MHLQEESLHTDVARRRGCIPPFWVLFLAFGLLLLFGMYAVIWFPWQAQQKTVAKLESLGIRVEYQEVGPEWLRNLTGKHPHGLTINPNHGGILDRVIEVRICASGRPRGGRVEIPPEIIRELQVFPYLKRLDLNYTNVTDDWMPAITELRSLQRLDLGHARVSGRGFQQLRKLHNLEELQAVYCPIRSQYLDQLVNVKSLKQVNLYRCSHLTPQDISDFRAARPDCDVQVDPNLEP